MAHVLFVCLHNAGRSQMSEALNQRSVGTRPSRRGRRPPTACIRRWSRS